MLFLIAGNIFREVGNVIEFAAGIRYFLAKDLRELFLGILIPNLSFMESISLEYGPGVNKQTYYVCA